MAIRLDSISFSSELQEKLDHLSFSNDSNMPFSREEIYLGKLLKDEGFYINKDCSCFIFDIINKSIRNAFSVKNEEVLCLGSGNTLLSIPINKVIFLPVWKEARNWLHENGYNMEYHYDPFFADENIKMGFMKPKKLSGTDNLIIEAEGKTDLEVIYKVLLAALKYEKPTSSTTA